MESGCQKTKENIIPRGKLRPVAESGRQKTKENIIPRRKFRLVEFSARSDICFCLKPIGGEWASKDKRKYHSARKIPPSGKRPQGLPPQLRNQHFKFDSMKGLSQRE